jgi:hypothetical protein
MLTGNVEKDAILNNLDHRNWHCEKWTVKTAKPQMWAVKCQIVLITAK